MITEAHSDKLTAMLTRVERSTPKDWEQSWLLWGEERFKCTLKLKVFFLITTSDHSEHYLHKRNMFQNVTEFSNKRAERKSSDFNFLPCLYAPYPTPTQ